MEMLSGWSLLLSQRVKSVVSCILAALKHHVMTLEIIFWETIKSDKPDIVIPELTLAQAVPSQVRAMPNSRSRNTRTWARSGRGGMALTERGNVAVL